MNALVEHIGGWHPGLIIVIALIAGTAIGGFLRRPIRGTLIVAGIVILLFLLLPGQRAGWQRAWDQPGWSERAECLGAVVSTRGMWSPSEDTWGESLSRIGGDDGCTPAQVSPDASSSETAITP